MLHTGAFIGPFAGGWYLSAYGFIAYFTGSSVVCVFLLLYVFLVLPESLSEKGVLHDSLTSHGPGNALLSRAFSDSTLGAVKLLFETRPVIAPVSDLGAPLLPTSPPQNDEHPQSTRLIFLSIAFMLTYGNTISASGIEVLYTAHAFKWKSTEIGLFLSVGSLVGVLFLLIYRRGLSRLLGYPPSDMFMAQVGAASSVISDYSFLFLFLYRLNSSMLCGQGLYYTLFACLRSPVAVWYLLPLLAIQTAATPSYRSMFSACFKPDEQGKIFAAVELPCLT